MNDTLYRRPLPSAAIAFSSSEGREIFGEALAAGTLDGYFPLAEQFHTQSEPAFCGLGSLVVTLNALGIDPGRLWKGPWRWFAEDLLDCCVPLAQVRERGLDMDELACLARCNGADVILKRADQSSPAGLRAALEISARGDAILLAAYDRGALGQSGAGHFSPLGGYHRGRDLALILDVARFKYPPHWVPLDGLWAAMSKLDPSSGMSRGWLLLSARAKGVALGYSLHCVGESWRGLDERLAQVVAEVAGHRELEDLARAVLPLTVHLALRTPSAPDHRQALDDARALLRKLSAYPRVLAAVGPSDVDAVLISLLAVSDRLSPEQQAQLGAEETNQELRAELAALRAQVSALRVHGRTRAAAVPSH